MSRNLDAEWERISALIDDTLAAGVHPETREANTDEAVDNDGNPRSNVFIDEMIDDDLARRWGLPAQRSGRDRYRGTGRTTRLLARAAQSSRDRGGMVHVVFAHLAEGRQALDVSRCLNPHLRGGGHSAIHIKTIDDDMRGYRPETVFYDHHAIESMFGRLEAELAMAERGRQFDPAWSMERIARERDRILSLPTEGPLSDETVLLGRRIGVSRGA